MGFSVACMALERPEILKRFIDHYRAVGAERIFLYYDGDASGLGLTSADDVDLVACSQAFWAARTGQRPAMVVPAQQVAFDDAFTRNTSDWLLVCDVDEFVAGDIAHALGAAPAGLDYVRIRPAEAVWVEGEDVETPFSNSLFRAPTPRFLGKALSLVVYGRDWRMFQRGIQSHIMGKSFVRRSACFQGMGLHFPKGTHAGKGTWMHVLAPDSKVWLYHFSAISFSRWKTKLGGRIDGSRRTLTYSSWQGALLKTFAAHAADGRERELFDRLFVLDRRKISILRRCGLLLDRQF